MKRQINKNKTKLGNNILSSRPGKCKGPEAGINLVYFRISMKASKVEKELWDRKQSGRR